MDFGILFCRDLFHDCIPLDFYVIVDSYLSINPSKILVLTGPSLIVRSSFLPFRNRIAYRLGVAP